MQQLVLFIWLILTSLVAAIGGWYADGVLGFLISLPCLWLWSIGTIYSTKEYHTRSVPDWMIWLCGRPKSSQKCTSFYNPIVDRLLSIFLLIALAVTGLLFAGFENSYLVVFLLTCVCGVYGIEHYFKSHYK